MTLPLVTGQEVKVIESKLRLFQMGIVTDYSREPSRHYTVQFNDGNTGKFKRAALESEEDAGEYPVPGDYL